MTTPFKRHKFQPVSFTIVYSKLYILTELYAKEQNLYQARPFKRCIFIEIQPYSTNIKISLVYEIYTLIGLSERFLWRDMLIIKTHVSEEKTTFQVRY